MPAPRMPRRWFLAKAKRIARAGLESRSVPGANVRTPSLRVLRRLCVRAIGKQSECPHRIRCRLMRTDAGDRDGEGAEFLNSRQRGALIFPLRKHVAPASSVFQSVAIPEVIQAIVAIQESSGRGELH